MAAPEKTAETKTAAPRVRTSPVIATQAKVKCTDRAFGPFTVCAALAACRDCAPGRRSRPWRKMAGIGEEWTICRSHIAAAKLALSCFPTNSTTPDRLREDNKAEFHGMVPKQPPVKAHSPNRRPDKMLPRMGRRCPLTPADPPGSIAAEFNDRVTKGVVPSAGVS